VLSLDDASRTEMPTPLARAMDYAERAEYMYISPGQAMVSAVLAMFWLRVAELSGQNLRQLRDNGPSRMTTD